MQLLKREIDRLRGLALYVRDIFSAYRQRDYEHGCCEIIVIRICISSHHFYMFVVYRDLDLSDNIFYFFMDMAKVQSVDRRRLFCLLAI